MLVQELSGAFEKYFMKLKQQPEDFQVEELTDVVPGSAGAFSLYRLEKQGWTTPDAVAVICRRWQIDRRRVSFGGLKDRHAVTVQHLSMFHGPERNLTHQRLKLTYLGKIAEPFTSAFIQANRFRLTLRALSLSQVFKAVQALAEVQADGIPNYFDDQRFGSAGPKGEFMARSLLAGQYEEALRKALLTPYEFDRAVQKKDKAVVRKHWGDWQRCPQLDPRCPARGPVDYLVRHPGDFQGALARLPADLRGLHLSAYQSHLWNRMLARWLRTYLEAGYLFSVDLRLLGAVPMYRGLPEPLRQQLALLHLPLPSGRIELDPADPRLQVLDAILREEGLQRQQWKLKGFKEMFFSRGDRAAIVLPAQVGHEDAIDDLNPDRQKLVLAFELPRGAYATLLVKRITEGFAYRQQ
jgi:tRNA pseudouridine13 synthase